MKKIRIKPLDRDFSWYIRTRDNYTCQRCHRHHPPPTNTVQAAHFFGRSNKATRWDPANVYTLCTACHFYFDGAGKEEFREFVRKRLGARRFKQLLERGRSCVPERIAAEEAKKLLQVI